MRRLLIALLAVATAHAEKAQPLLHLADGRVLYGRAVQKSAKRAVLKTDFGALVVPGAAFTGETTARRTKPEPKERVTKTKWLEITNDLSEERGKLYADQLDAFFDWMLRVYALDVDRVRKGAPYRMHVFRRREDFKRLQAEVAPSIERKGKAFAEGTAGFYSPSHGKIFMWDAEGAHGGVHLEVAKHETTHLLNDLMARQIGIRVPTWFEEGAATYFSTYIASGAPKSQEPEDHPGAYAQVLGDIEENNALKSRALRDVKWENFLGREYSWGWAQVRFFRHYKSGKYWAKLLAYLRTIAPMGPVTDSEERRFLKMVKFKTSEAFDEAWHTHLVETKPDKERSLVGTSPAVLKRVAAMKKPDAATARTFARIGISLARVRETGPAIVYLRAAMRGGIEDPEVPYRLAVALAFDGQLADDEPWPDEAVDALRTATTLAPLRAGYRQVLGRQLLLRGEVEAAYSMLGLALVLTGENDDDVTIALGLLHADAAFHPERALEQRVAALAEAVPPAVGALKTAMVYYLQEAEDWESLARTLAARVDAKTATLAERAMLAGIHKASDDLEEAEAIYAAILEEEPTALRYWPDRIECLVRLGRTADAKLARKKALEAVREDPRNLGWIRRRLERIRID